MKTFLLTAAVLAAATSAVWAQGYPYPVNPYGYGFRIYGNDPSFPGVYAYIREPNAAPPSFYGYDPYGTASNWEYYRSSGPGRGNNEESQR